MRAVTLLTVLFLASSANTVAQRLPVQPGQRVRVTAGRLGLDKQEAVFRQWSGDTAVIQADSVMHCPWSIVTRLDVYEGRKSNLGGGLRTGAAVGALLGLAVGVAGYVGCSGSRGGGFCPAGGPQGNGGEVLVVMAYGAAAGALIGGAFGALSTSEHWRRVPRDVRVGVVPRHDGFSVGARIAF